MAHTLTNVVWILYRFYGINLPIYSMSWWTGVLNRKGDCTMQIIFIFQIIW